MLKLAKRLLVETLDNFLALLWGLVRRVHDVELWI